MKPPRTGCLQSCALLAKEERNDVDRRVHCCRGAPDHLLARGLRLELELQVRRLGDQLQQRDLFWRFVRAARHASARNIAMERAGKPVSLRQNTA